MTDYPGSGPQTGANHPSLAQTSLPEDRSWVRGFWALIITQFQGAFSDNTLKTLVIFLIMGMALPEAQRQGFVPLVNALFALPFILFSMVGGYLADRYSKRTVAIGVKLFEIAVMLFALAALTLNDLSLQLLAVFLMGVHSALFGPSKYGLLPELLAEKRLSWGNGILEMGTFMAIITGTVAGAFLTEHFHGRQFWSGLVLLCLALFGFLASLNISRLPPAAPQKKFQLNFVADLARNLRLIRKDRALWLALLGNTYFFFLGALLQVNIVLYGKNLLHLPDSQNGYLQAALAVGIGLGSLAAGFLSGNKIEYGLIPLGAIGLTTFCAWLSKPGLTFASFALLLALLGFFSGFFIVPIAALLQHRPAKEAKGGVLATANLLSFIGVFCASGLYYFLATVLGLNPRWMFLLSAGLTVGVTVYLVFLLPDSLARFIFWLLTHTIYRVRVEGRDHIPAKGGALFVSNHLSLADALLVLASTDRLIRFIIYQGYYDLPWVKPFARALKAIPISNERRPREILTSLRAASQAIAQGDVVCIFAEGQITRIGQLLPFRRGFQRIMRDLDAPIIPVCLDRVWGSIFSFERGRFYSKWPRQIPYPVTVTYGQPLPPTATPAQVRQTIQELQSISWAARKSQITSLGRTFIRTCRRSPQRFAMADGDGRPWSFMVALARVILLGRRLRPLWQTEPAVGILLPPSVGACLVTLAAAVAGKVVVHLPSTSREAASAAIKKSGVGIVVMSKCWPWSSGPRLAGKVIILEEIAADFRAVETAFAMFLASIGPIRVIERILGLQGKIDIDDVAAISFTEKQGEDSDGVLLTHYNLISNVEQIAQVFALTPKDRLLATIPLFSSFGFTPAVILPIATGLGVVYPRDSAEIHGVAESISKHRVNILFTTQPWLEQFMQQAQPKHPSSLELVIVTGRDLPEPLARSFQEKFGPRPMGCYGRTECGPFISVNTRDFRAGGLRQVGSKPGTMGHPLPGVSVRIVDLDRGLVLPANEFGTLLVRGPNVMKGYVSGSDETQKVFLDGWYVTGDRAALDEDGFLHS